jgi:hypothetical protein
MYIDVRRIVDEPDGDHEIHIMIIETGNRPVPASFTVTDYTLRRFDALHSKGRKCHGKALALLKREGRSNAETNHP